MKYKFCWIEVLLVVISIVLVMGSLNIKSEEYLLTTLKDTKYSEEPLYKIDENINSIIRKVHYNKTIDCFSFALITEYLLVKRGYQVEIVEMYNPPHVYILVNNKEKFDIKDFIDSNDGDFKFYEYNKKLMELEDLL